MSQRPSSMLDDLQMPVELTRARRTPTPRYWLPLALAGVFACLAEVAFMTQDAWLADAGVRTLLTPLLESAGYALKRPVLADCWQIEGLSLAADETRAEVWRVDAVLVQHADILQPWPRLRLRLRDWQGMTVAQRDLAPADYLPADLPHPIRGSRLAVPDQPVRIRVDVMLPLRANGTRAGFEQASLKVLP